jgi:hypothetical protein
MTDSPRERRRWRLVAVDLAVLAVAYWLYSLVRNDAPDAQAAALRRGRDLFSAERALHIDAAAYTAGRGWVEALRVDHANHFLGLRLNDWTSLVIFLAAVGFLPPLAAVAQRFPVTDLIDPDRLKQRWTCTDRQSTRHAKRKGVRR